MGQQQPAANSCQYRFSNSMRDVLQSIPPAAQPAAVCRHQQLWCLMQAHRLTHAALRRAVLGTCRKAKQSLLTDGVQGLQKLKKKSKGVTKAIIEEREKQVGVHRPPRASTTTSTGSRVRSPPAPPTAARPATQPSAAGRFSKAFCLAVCWQQANHNSRRPR